MAITRRQRREPERIDSRQLRSSKRLPAPPVTALSGRRRGNSCKTRQLGSLVVAHSNPTADETAPEHFQQYGHDQSDHAAPTPSSASRTNPQSLVMGIDGNERSRAPACFRDSSHLQGSLPASEVEKILAETPAVAQYDPHMPISTSGVVASKNTSGRRDPEDVGVPIDDKWDLVAAHEKRFCFDHEEAEWLLEYAERWMYLSDFGVIGAEETLKGRLQKYHIARSNSKPHWQPPRAECNHSLWSQVDTPVQQADVRDEVIYLVRWKLCWTAQSNIDDLDWVKASYEARNRVNQRRSSKRVEETADERVAKRDKMMVVVNLEDLLL